MSDEMGTTTTLLTESESRLVGTEQGAIRGPWKFLPGKFNNPELTGGTGSIVTDEDDPWYIASIEDAPHSDANARLIAAAPDMLAALDAAVGYLLNAKIDLETGGSRASAILLIEFGLTMTRNAIAKAEGRTP